VKDLGLPAFESRAILSENDNSSNNAQIGDEKDQPVQSAILKFGKSRDAFDYIVKAR